MSRRVLVTGGAGFVGSTIADALAARGDLVVVVDDLATGDRTNVSAGVELVVADIADQDALFAALGGRRFDAVVHCASKTKVVESMANPDLYRRVIVQGTAIVLGLAAATGARRFVNFSSGGVAYGETSACATEETPVAPISPYGIHKIAAEALVAAAATPAVTLRPANIYGPRQRADLEGGVIAIFAGRWRTGQPLVVRGPGTAERDYVYVGDVADAVRAALEHDVTGVYNIGTGIATSVNAIVSALTEILGPPAGIVHEPLPAVELERSCVDPGKAWREFGWRAQTSLAEGLRRTCGVS
ncbi:MAG TPA: NAD-dependent epimerase/dehydratase family protein [Candidatus Limnocylindria bacterium]|jgi:UDP-glucose 4-epimerase